MSSVKDQELATKKLCKGKTTCAVVFIWSDETCKGAVTGLGTTQVGRGIAGYVMGRMQEAIKELSDKIEAEI